MQAPWRSQAAAIVCAGRLTILAWQAVCVRVMMLLTTQDAFGAMVQAYYDNPAADVDELVERDDGLLDFTGGPAAYFAPFESWSQVEQEAMAHVRGRVLDVGCGPGRVALYLQEQGHEVVGVDNSPGAIRVARQRGVRHVRELDVTQITLARLGQFDTVVMLGNNLGLLGQPVQARMILRRLAAMTGPAGRIVAQTRDIYQTDEAVHLTYQQRNRETGRPAGLIRVRVRYRHFIGPWLDYLMVAPDELAELIQGTGWMISALLTEPDSAVYVAVLERVSG